MRVEYLSQGKALIWLFELQAELAIYFTEHHFHLKEADKPWLFQSEYLADIFLKMNNVSLSL